MRTRFERLGLAWRTLVQTAAAATVAYLIATEVAGHSQAFFAPIAAIITLGITVGQRGRRAVELALGVAVGIAVADALVLLIGNGVAAIAVVCRWHMAPGSFSAPANLRTQRRLGCPGAVLQPEGRASGRAFVDALICGGVALLATRCAARDP